MSDLVIDSFRGKYDFLSNFYFCEVEYLGDIYTTVEHAYQAAKADDPIDRLKILYTKMPSQAKRLGRNIKIRPGWDEVKLYIMYELVHDKFMRSKVLSKALLETGDATLIEGNTWGDTYWGVCNGVGDNNLGKILMRVRENIKEYPREGS